jgi:hypothetical protein
MDKALELDRKKLVDLGAIDDDDECTCDIDGEDSCPLHYPIDDGTDDDDCMDCGSYFEQMEDEQ